MGLGGLEEFFVCFQRSKKRLCLVAWGTPSLVDCNLLQASGVFQGIVHE